MVTRIHLQPVLSHYSSIFIFTIAPESGVGTSFGGLFNCSIGRHFYFENVLPAYLYFLNLFRKLIPIPIRVCFDILF